MANKKIQLTTNVDNQIVDVYPVTKSEFVEFSDGKTLDEKINTVSTEHKHNLATPAKDGFMSKEDKAKLDGVTNYTHPNTHAATMITEDNDHRFVTDAEKNKWNNKVDAVLATNASNGLMSASDKQKIDDLNNQFKNRDDKIEKNKQDVKSLNDEVIEKEYSYFNNQSTILNTISGKTKDMIIKGKTFHNIFPTDTSKLVTTNVEVLDSIYTITPRTDQYSNIWDVKNMLYKPNTEYTVVIDILENRLIKKDNVANNLCFFMCGYENTESVFGDNGLQKVLSDKTSERIVKKIRTIEDFSVLSNNFGARFFLNNVFTGGTLKLRIKVLEGDWTENLIPENIEGLQNFGDKIEENKYKINSIAIGKNLFNKNQFSQYFNGKEELVFKQTGNTRVNNHFVIHSSKDPFAIQVLNAGDSPNSRTFKTINQEKYYILMGLNGDKRDNKVWGEILLPRNTTCTFSSINNSGDNAWVSFKDIQIEIGDSKTKYQDYKANKADIYLKDDLKQINEDIFDYINYDLNIRRNVKRHIFTEKDAWLQGSCNNETHIGFYVLWNTVGGKSHTKCKCDKFRLISLDNYNNVKIEGYLSDIGFNVKIAKNRLPSGTIEGFKEWLKTNPIEVLFEAENPIIEKCDCLDTNLYTYSGNTFITCDNDVKGDMSFTVPMNLGASFDNNSDRIDLIEDTLKNNNDNKSRIEKLEEGAITSSLNIIDLQKEISNKNNYTHYEGNNIFIEDSKNFMTSNMIVKGETLQNLFSGKIKDIYNANRSSSTIRQEQDGYITLIKRQYGDCIHTDSSLYKPNTNYTLIIDVKENTLNGDCYMYTDDRSVVVANEDLKIKAGQTGITRHTFTTINDFSTTRENKKWGFYLHFSQKAEVSQRGNITLRFLLLEGDWTNREIPDYFEGIKSLGEDENNEIKIKSNNKNIFNLNIKPIELNNTKASVINNGIKVYNEKENIWSNVAYLYKVKPNTDYSLQFDVDDKNNSFVAVWNYPRTYTIKDLGITNGTFNTGDNTVIQIAFHCTLGTSKKNSLNYTNIQLEEGPLTSFVPYEDNEKIIKLNNPLHKENYLYEENKQIKEYRKFVSYKFTGEECFEKYVSQSEGFLCLILKQNDIKTNGKIYCNNFINQYIWAPGILREGIELNITAGNKAIFIKIKNDRLKTNDIDGFKRWLKENPTTIVYELENPIIETVENVFDLNAQLFDNYTNISFSNSIPGNLEFDKINNLATQILNNSKNTNKINNNLTAINKQFDADKFVYYEGQSIIINNTLNSRTSNIVIKGETLQNVYKTKGEYNGQVIEVDLSLFKPNTKYTIFHNTRNWGLSDHIVFASEIFTDVYYLNNNTVFTTKETIPSRSYFHCYLKNEDLGVSRNIFNKLKITILEGDWSNKNVPSHFEGIKSVGEDEENKIKIISNKNNLFNIKGNVNESFEDMITGQEENIVKGNDLIIGNWSSSHHGRGQIIKLKPNTKYKIKADRKNNTDICISVATRRNFYFKDYRAANNEIINYSFITGNEFEYCISFTASGNKPVEKPIISNIMLCEDKDDIVYEEYREDKKEIQLKSPLIEGDYLYEEDNKIKVFRNSKLCNILEDDKMFLSSIQSEGFLTVKILKNDLKNEGKIYCSNFVNSNLIWKQETRWEGIQTVCYEEENTSWIFIKISKSRLNTPDLSGFKDWLKNNPMKIICELRNPIIEVVDTCIDANIKTYKDSTFIKSNNDINGYLSFNIPINLLTQTNNNTDDINKTINAVNNISEKCFKLEDAQMTTALNVLELQKHTAMLDNGNLNEYSDHSGYFIKCDNTLDSRTENMVVKGKTLVNLFNGKKVNIGSYSSFACTYKDGVFDLNAKTVNVIISYPKMELEDNKKYTLICHVMENTLTPMTGTAFRLIRPESYGAEVFLPASFTRGVFKTTFTTNKNNASGWNDTHANLFVISATGRIKFSIMVFEGDIDYIPYHFEGIKSLGEQENNNINLVSYTDNLLYNIKKVFLSVENGKESISDIYFTSDFAYAPLSTYYKSLLDNEYVLTNVFYYGKDKEYLYQINIVEKDSFDNYPNAKYIRLVGRRADKGTNVNLDNVKIIVGSKKYTEYFESKIDQRTIQLKEPLCEDDFVYEDNKAIKVFKKSKSYTFTGDETNNGVFYNDNNTQLEKTHLFYVNDPMFKSKNNKVICNSLKTIEANQLAKLDEPYIFCRGDGVLYFNLYKKDLSTVNTTGFKQWIKNNPTTVISYLDNPVIKELSCIDTNVDTYKDTTYVTTDNSIKGELEFKTQNNFGAIMKNVNRCISKIFNSLNNILNIKGE